MKKTALVVGLFCWSSILGFPQNQNATQPSVINISIGKMQAVGDPINTASRIDCDAIGATGQADAWSGFPLSQPVFPLAARVSRKRSAEDTDHLRADQSFVKVQQFCMLDDRHPRELLALCTLDPARLVHRQQRFLPINSNKLSMAPPKTRSVPPSGYSIAAPVYSKTLRYHLRQPALRFPDQLRKVRRKPELLP